MNISTKMSSRRTLTSKCIILGHRNIGENDKLIFLYNNEEGKMSAIAKGARKIKSKFTGHLETLNYVQMSFYFAPRNIIITESLTINNYKNLRGNLEKLQTSIQIAEATDKLLFQNQQINGLIKLINETLDELSKSQRSFIIFCAYITKLLDKTGMLPDFQTINTKLEKKYLKLFHYLKTESITKASNIVTNDQEETQIKNFLQRAISYQTESEIKSLS